MKKELLQHYKFFEEMLQEIKSQSNQYEGKFKSLPEKFTILNPSMEYSSIIPSQKETQQGLENIFTGFDSDIFQFATVSF